jgi:predicted DNA-binding transcriptional regulator AlpA
MEELSSYARRQLFMRSKKILATARGEYSTRKELAEMYGVAEITVRMWERRSDDFPKPLRTGVSGKHHAVYYKTAEVQAWLDARAGGRSHTRRVVSAVK